MIALLAAALLAPLSSPGTQDPSTRTQDPSIGTQDLSTRTQDAYQGLPAILLRTPDELPRAAAGRWDGLFDAEEERRDEVLRSVPAEVLAVLRGAEQSYHAPDYPLTLEHLYEVLTREPDFPPALLMLGTTYFRLRRYGDCIEACERFVETSPSQVWRTQVLSHGYYSLGEYEQARDHYERVLAAMPGEIGESPEALRGLALAHMRLGAEEQALELLARVIELRPRHAEAHTWRGRILYRQDRLEEALEAALRAQELDPFEPQPWYLAMKILYELDREEEALEAEVRWQELDRVAQEVRALEMRLRFDPRQYGAAVRLVELHRSVGNLPAVRQALAQEVLARPEEVPEVEVRIRVLDTLFSMGDVEGARVAALALEQACPRETRAWKRLELFYALLRDRVNQVRCGEMARRLGGGE
ncbi:MAG: tetratricopeptide repeat protein [Planctomycetota bacterium]|nr:tetratricopeptide repeat protein [Planctomycetota bacterium]